MHLFRKHIVFFRGLALFLMLHLFNYSVNMEDHVLLNNVGLSDEHNETETFVELILTALFEEDGALADEANGIDETKVIAGIIAVVPPVLAFQARSFPAEVARYCKFHARTCLDIVLDICPPPPKSLV